MAGYSKELIVNAYLHRFVVGGMDINVVEKLEALANTHYDKVGRDKFREHASVTPEAIKIYKQVAG
jgi:hypothetical protein